MRTRWHFRRSSRHALRELLEGDLLFFENDGDGGSGDNDDSQGGDGDGGGDDDTSRSQADNDDSQGGDGDDSKAETVSGDEYRSKLAENKSLRQRAKKAEDALAELKKLDETDQQRRDRELEEEKKTSAKHAAEARDLRVQVAAATVGIRPEATKAAGALIDWTDVDQDDADAVEKALKGLKEKHAYLFKSTDIGAGEKDRGKKNGQLADDASPHQRLSSAYSNAK